MKETRGSKTRKGENIYTIRMNGENKKGGARKMIKGYKGYKEGKLTDKEKGEIFDVRKRGGKEGSKDTETEGKEEEE